MCGIFGYIGQTGAAKRILEGLRRLEYRGYDSWGIAVVEPGSNTISLVKKVGKIGTDADISILKESGVGIGHTRWATHGGVSEINAHPHFSTDKSFAVAQNGIVENYQELKSDLILKGYKFVSQTDTEIIVRLIEEKLKTADSLRSAVRNAFVDLTGRNTIIVLSSSGDEVIAVRNGSPLVIGVSDNGEIIFASDTLSFGDITNKVVFLNDMDMGWVKYGELKLFNVTTDQMKNYSVVELDNANVDVSKEGYDHFMIKEIVEQKHTIREAVSYTEEEIGNLVNAIKDSRKVYTLGAGTAGYAAGQIAYSLRKIGHVDAQELKPYEIDSYIGIMNSSDLVLTVSQSGETADTIEALEKMKQIGMKVASIVNMLGSTISRISDYAYFSRSGPEICVASTKAFTAQVSFGYLVAMTVAGKYADAKKEIYALSDGFGSYFGDDLLSQIRTVAEVLKDREHFFVLGRGQNYYIALEGSLKVKEITYKHFEGFSAGELKHGVISLVEKGTPVFAIFSNDEHKSSTLNSVAEVKARGAFVVGIAPEKNELFDMHIPVVDSKDLSSIANVIPFQLLSYELGVLLDRDPDKPRNLAKSVTVK